MKNMRCQFARANSVRLAEQRYEGTDFIRRGSLKELVKRHAVGVGVKRELNQIFE